ncbi:MAG TPA: DUF433 domain-containing protein [Egibacteraceae bacterium]|jgi:DNA-binding transcriptional MerR regulator/uncharacterized protein (DUF433 family)|nr:DUF433 domain-containing protein [Egibacteraceae bacterium]
MTSAATVSQLDLGHYEAERAAALAGVPRSTLYYWARTDLIVPSISPHREKLWSYRDLLTLRLVRWLRLPKDDLGVAATTMSEVREVMDTVGERLWSIDERGREVPTILVGRDGTVFLGERPLSTLGGQVVLEHDQLDLFAPFDRGVDLRVPRPRLRIVPGKVAGEPHLVGSRLTTRTVAGLAVRGLSVAQIAVLYPHEEPEALAEAVELERSLAA